MLSYYMCVDGRRLSGMSRLGMVGGVRCLYSVRSGTRGGIVQLVWAWIVFIWCEHLYNFVSV